MLAVVFPILVQTCKVPKSHAAADLLRFFLKKSFFIIIKALKNIADFILIRIPAINYSAFNLIYT